MLKGTNVGDPVSVQSGQWLLAIDTSTDLAGIAAQAGPQLVDLCWPSARRHTETVAPAIERLVIEAGLSLESLGAVAVAIGPGSFTGLRVGLAIAKGIIALSDRILIGVPTLDLVARSNRVANEPLLAAIAAGRGRIVSARYGDKSSAPTNRTFEEFISEAQGDPLVPIAGEFTETQRAELESHGLIVLDPGEAPSRVASLARIGCERWQVGDIDDAATLEPVYLHGRPNPR